MSTKATGRGHFSSSLGFILAATGSAVGLGNLWKFPYVAGNSGGGLFLIFYIFFVLILGVPLLITEISIGRKTHLNPIGAYKSLDKKWSFIGISGVVCAFIILSYYSVVGGWVLKYFFAYLGGTDVGSNSSAYFADFISSSAQPVIWHLVFMAAAVMIVIFGVSKGIEKVSKIMLPGLFILMIVLCIRSLTLDGASAGLEFFLKPHAHQLSSFSGVVNVMEQALGQVFFSLSIGMGALITYGSYLKKDSNIVKSSFIIAGLDSLIAILAGIAILPAVFALGFEPTAGPGLIFETIPAVFNNLPAGRIFGALFFLLVFFAAITSAISILEVVTSYLIDRFKISRKISTVCVASVMALLGVFASLSMGPMAEFKILNMNIFDFLGFLSDKLLMPIGGIFTCIFVGHRMKVARLADEITEGMPNKKWKLMKAYEIIIKWVAPVLIFAVFVFGLI